MSALQEFMANGPDRNDLLEKDAHIWERPWSVEEIRQHGANWSLAADSGLFLYLQDFSQKMLSKTHEIEKQLDSLIRDTKATDSRLHSVFNDFLMLSNTQFIENRVYDEEVDETLSKPEVVQKHPEQERTREQKEAELIPKMQEAVNYGLKVLESAFEHLDIKAGNSDSEDEDAADKEEAILEPKDLYVDRPLPYLIGSQAFMEQDDVGLGDLSSDEMSVYSDRDSVMEESEEEKEAIKSSLSFEDDEEEEEDSDIFGDSDKDDDDAKSTDPSLFTKELNARIRGEPVNKPEGDRASLASKRSKGRTESKSAASLADEEDSDDMFKPPKMDEEDDYSPFGGKSGLFSGGKGLFDDDDEGDLFSENSKPASQEGKAANESLKSTAAESSKPSKRIPVGAVSIFPDNNLFVSKQDSDPEESKGNGAPATKDNATGGGGLFDNDDEDEDDFFSGNGLKKPNSVVQEKPKLKKAVDLFDDEDSEDIFNEKYSPQLTQSKKEVVVEEKKKSSEKKMLPGAVSVFGPGTKSLLSEGLKKRQPSTSEESEKSEEKALVADVGRPSAERTRKVQTRGLFSDDEDAPIFPTIPKSQSQPEPASQREARKTSFLLFDDEEEEDLFASAVKSKAKPSAPQPSKAVASSLFSDDEDQWMSSQSKQVKPEPKSGGMKTSTSAPSSLPGTKTSKKSSLFDKDDDDDDLFAPTKVSSQKKSPKVALLFEDEGDDEDKDTLFGIKPAVNANTGSLVKPPSGISESPEASKKVTKEQPSAQQKREEESPSPPQESGEIRKKPAGGVSLFGGIDVLASKQEKSHKEEADDIFLSKDSPLTNVRDEGKEDKAKIKSVSLFDEEEEDESSWKDPIVTPKKPPEEKIPEPTEERLQINSTGVFLDEELLFSQTQQKDNDPDVDLFAASPNASVDSSKLGSAKDTAQSLFADDEEDEDDLFSSIKPKAPPKVAEKPRKPTDRAPLASPEPVSEIHKPAPRPVKPSDSSSRIGKLQASLMINPTALLPGSVSNMSGPLSSSSGVSSSSLSPSPATTPIDAHTDSEIGVSFDTPVQFSTLQSAHKDRVKGSALRRPQSRAARQQAAQKSNEADETDVIVPNYSLGLPQPKESSQTHLSPTLPNSTTPPIFPTPSPSQPSLSESSPRPSELPLPGSTSSGKKVHANNSRGVRVPLSSDEDDIFGSDDLFGATPNKISSRETSTGPPQASNAAAVKKDKEKSPVSSIFDDNADDLFQSVKPRADIKKATTSSFLAEDEDDLFGLSHSSTSTSSKDFRSSRGFSKQEIFQDEGPSGPKPDKKNREKTIDASLFDDDVDIFADLSDTLKPKQKSKTKGEIKSIFDDDMDDIFAVKTVKPAAKAPQKSVKASSQENSTAANSSNLFDDPLNALGGN
uniref:FAM21/CAPZIP domain-containing protein n=1 Tax=Oryzias sinensis TaxID=183150 RepID=A0A8C7X5A0_9TELE